MSRRKEIAKDLWAIFQQVYKIHPDLAKTEKQEELLERMMDYLEANLSLRRKKTEGNKDDQV